MLLYGNCHECSKKELIAYLKEKIQTGDTLINIFITQQKLSNSEKLPTLVIHWIVTCPKLTIKTFQNYQ